MKTHKWYDIIGTVRAGRIYKETRLHHILNMIILILVYTCSIGYINYTDYEPLLQVTIMIYTYLVLKFIAAVIINSYKPVSMVTIKVLVIEIIVAIISYTVAVHSIDWNRLSNISAALIAVTAMVITILIVVIALLDINIIHLNKFKEELENDNM